jgi:hypothetical protein
MTTRKVSFFYSLILTGLVLIGPSPLSAQQLVPLQAGAQGETQPGGAQNSGSVAPSPFTVQNVAVDVKAENAITARNQAFEQAQISAFEELAGRMLPEEQLTNFKAPALGTIAPMVQDFEVSNEKVAKGRYSAIYTVRFRERAARRYFDRLTGQNPEPALATNAGAQAAQSPSQAPAPDLSAAPAYSPYAPAALPTNRVQMRAAFNSLQEWAAIQRALGRAYGIRNITLLGLSPREATLEIAHDGDLNALQFALAQSDLTLNNAGGRGYVLSLNPYGYNGAQRNVPRSYNGQF